MGITKLIDKDELIETIMKSPVWTGLDAIARINAMPTTDIVRCKECRRQKSCVTFEGIGDYDGFCSNGKREE